MALLAFQTIPRAGITPSFTAVNASDTITAAGGGAVILLRVKNTSGSPSTVTLTDAGSTPAGSVATNPTVNVPATTGDVTIYIDPDLVNTSTGLITVSYAPTTSVTAALLTV